jgi:hypothetical protein
MSAAFFLLGKLRIANILLTGPMYRVRYTKSGLIMDNIQKLVFGVLGISGLLAMLTPSNLAVPQPATAVEAPQPLVESPNPDGEAPLPDDEIGEGEEIDDDPFAIGEPSIDGMPIGQQFDGNQRDPDEGPQNEGNQPQYTIPDYGNQPAQSYSSAPPTYNVPIGPDGYAQLPGQ